MKTFTWYENRHGGFSIKEADSYLIGPAVDVGGARTAEIAALFAAAPDMLAALKLALPFLEDASFAAGDPSSFAKVIQAALGAIAKAEGREG